MIDMVSLDVIQNGCWSKMIESKISLSGTSAFDRSLTQCDCFHAKAILNSPSTYEIINTADFGMTRYVHVASHLTSCNAMKSHAQQLNIEMTDTQYECTAKIKALTDIRLVAIDNANLKRRRS